MPKYNFMISRAVDLVARKLAGMDPETVARLTQVLSDEAQIISEELQHNGQNVDSDILAARLEGLVARIKYEARNKDPDPSPYEFPIFNVSNNPDAPYPNPINHLYDRRYKEAYSTSGKQKQPTSSSSQKTTPSQPSSSKPTTNSNSSSYPTYSQGQYKQPPPPGFLPGYRQQQSTEGWQYIDPYGGNSPTHNVYYQPSAVQRQSSTDNSQTLRRSSTADDVHSNSLSRSASNNDINYSTNSGKEKIRVRVINDGSTSPLTDSQMGTSNNRSDSPRLILKTNNDTNNNKEKITTRTVYASPNTEINSETMEDILKVVDKQRSEDGPVRERIIIIERRGSSAPDNNPNSSNKDRYRTYEVRTSAAEKTPTTPSSPAATTSTSTPTTTTSSTARGLQQPTYYTGQQFYYQQPKMYTSVPNNLYSMATPYTTGVNGFYPFVYYRY